MSNFLPTVSNANISLSHVDTILATPHSSDSLLEIRRLQNVSLCWRSPFPAVIRNLGFKTTRFGSVFNEVSQPAASPGGVLRHTYASTVTQPPANHIINAGGLGAVQPEAPAELSTLSNGHSNPKVQVRRLQPVLRNEDGLRIDRPLEVVNTVVERLKEGKIVLLSLPSRGMRCTLRQEPCA